MKFTSLFATVLLGLLFVVPAVAQRLTAEEARKKIEENTPAALPQSPRIPKARSDAEDERLKGKVKSVTYLSEESEDGKKEIRIGSVYEYDPSGAIVKTVRYDWQGNPIEIEVYGWLDGMRVTAEKRIKYSYSVPDKIDTTPNRVPITYDDRYSASYVYRYDNKKRLIEETSLWNTGKLVYRIEYVYSGLKVTSNNFDWNNKPNGSTVENFDTKANVISSSRFDERGNRPTEINYDYETIDSHGNWTRRSSLMTRVNGAPAGSFKTLQMRTITYYK